MHNMTIIKRDLTRNSGIFCYQKYRKYVNRKTPVYDILLKKKYVKLTNEG